VRVRQAGHGFDELDHVTGTTRFPVAVAKTLVEPCSILAVDFELLAVCARTMVMLGEWARSD
jgi:hypothetical protein